MARMVQLSGMYKSNSTAFFQVKAELEQFGMLVAHPLSDGFIFTQAGAPGLVSALWTPYEANLDYYETIDTSDALVVVNEDGHIKEPVARGMLYAMLQHKPLVLTRQPTFDSHLSHSVRTILATHAQGYIVLDLLADDRQVAQSELEALPVSFDYHLGQREQSTIKATIRSYFRGLLHSKKTTAGKTVDALALAA